MRVWAIACSALFGVATFGILGFNLILLVIVGELNRKRQRSNQLSAFFYTPGRISAIFREYRLRYPEGRFLSYAYLCVSITVASVLSSTAILLYALHLIRSGMVR